MEWDLAFYQSTPRDAGGCGDFLTDTNAKGGGPKATLTESWSAGANVRPFY